MRQVAPHPLWIGHVGDLRRVRELIDQGIEAVVELAANESAAVLPRNLIHLHIPLVDGDDTDPRLIRMAVASVAKLLQENIPTLVACSAGMSRSPSVAAAALSVVTHDSPEKCLTACTAGSPADVSPSLWNQICALIAPNGERR